MHLCVHTTMQGYYCSDMIWILYDWIDKFCRFQLQVMALIVDIIDGYGPNKNLSLVIQ